MHCRVTANPGASWIGDGNRSNSPGNSIVLRDDYRLLTAATWIRNVDGAILGRDFHVTVQATAVKESVERHRRPVVRSAVIASRTKRGRNVLRTIIDGVGGNCAGRPSR